MKCDGIIGEAMEQDEKLCDVLETVREFTYLGSRVSVAGKFYSAVTTKARCG